jgi:6-phosphofructokinase
LTNLEQSTSPSPFDRIFGIKLGQFSAEWLLENMKTPESENAVVIGLGGLKYLTTPVIQLMKNTDFEYVFSH